MYKIEVDSRVVKYDIANLSSPAWDEIRTAINKKLLIAPLSYSKQLADELKTYRKLRVGDYRVVFKITANVIIIAAIGHRKDIYKIAKNRVN